MSLRDMILRVYNKLQTGPLLENAIGQLMEIQHMFSEGIAEDILWVLDFMEILAEQSKELLKIANHPLFGADKPEEPDMTERDSHSEAETVIKVSVEKRRSKS